MIDMGTVQIILIVTVATSWTIHVVSIVRLKRKRRLRIAMCACGHQNYVHSSGTGACLVAHGISEKFPNGSCCACNIFIERLPDKPIKDKGASELEKMLKL